MDNKPALTSPLADMRTVPLTAATVPAVLDRLRPAPADPSKPAVAAFNASL